VIAPVRDRATFGALAQARRRSGRLVWVRYAPDGSVPPRVAFAIGRKAGTAVVRNRIRRRLRAILRSPALPAGAWLVGAFPGAGTASYADLRDETLGLVALFGPELP
jgi:ribonuclease P protein component